MLIYLFPQSAPFDSAHSYLATLSFILIITSVFITAIWQKRGGLKAWYQSLSGDYIWELNAAGLSLKILADASNPIERNAFYAWSKVLAVTENDEAWFVFVARKVAVCIPKRAQSANNHHEFIVHASKYWSQHPDNFGLRLATTLPTAIPQKLFWFALLSNIKLGIKNAFLIKVQPLEFKVSLSQLLGLLLLDALSIALFDYLKFYPSAIFNTLGISNYLAQQSLFLFACIAITTLIYSQAWLLRIMVIIAATLLAPSIIYMAIMQIFPTQNHTMLWGLWATYIMWTLLTVYRSIQNLFQLPKPIASYLLAIFTFIALALNGLFMEQGFFSEDYSEYKENTPNIDEEAVYYNQPQLVENMLHNLAPQRTGVTDMYYLGFAGYGYQKVFSNEVKFAQDLFNQKFDTKNRSATLITHESTLNTTPLANTHNLASTLKGIAKKMDVNEDILFLFLSSHGSKSFNLSVSLYPFDMKNLAATDVKKMLDEAGIKNRVIVISACYSGGFIDALKDENTLILTAARKDRASFGCSDDAEFTYFGNAYFVQALQKEKSFIKAFEQAKNLIASREKVEQKNDKPSLPQMFEGDAIKPKLEAWLQTLH